MPPKRITNHQQRTGAQFVLPPEAATIVIGLSPDGVPANATIDVGITAVAPLRIAKLVVAAAYADTFDVVDLFVAGKSALQSHAGAGVSGRAFIEGAAPLLLPLKAEEGERVMLRIRNRNLAPYDFRAWILATPLQTPDAATDFIAARDAQLEGKRPALPEPPRRVR